MSTPPMRILILCTANSARSQMAEGLMRHAAPPGTEVVSAGTVATFVRPEAITVLAELGIDISAQYSKTLDSVANGGFDYLITVCDNAREACPVLPGVRRQLHWSLPDPAAVSDEAARLSAFRSVRDDLRARIASFLSQLHAAR